MAADHTITLEVINKGIEEAVKLLSELRNDIKSINNTTITPKVNMANATRAINDLRKELSSLYQMGSQGSRNNTDAMIEAMGNEFDRLIDKMDEINRKDINPQVNSDSIEEAASRAERLASRLEVAASVASSLSSVFSGLGDFGGFFADSFGAMSSMFSFDALGTAKRYLTAMATRAITGQISGTIQRYDIMNTFEDYMALAGVDTATANAALNRVDQSIRGIPIGLDEAAFRLRKYQMYMNDIDRATDFTIGIQKAITAGGASEQMKTTAYTQIDRLLATGKLGQSRQWLSLFNGLGVSLRFLREELALDPTADLKQIASDLASGTIPVEDFISAIERLADNEGLDRALEIYKGTIEAWQSNINNAVKRAGQNIMENVNGVMEDTLGYGITGVMKNIRDGIDTMSKEAGNYIKDNPQHAVTLGNAISGLVQRVMTLDGGRFVDNIIRNVSGIADVISEIIGSLPDNFIEDFISFATTWAGPLATVAKAAQSGIGAVFGVFERMQKLKPDELIKKIVKQIENMAKVVAKLLDKIPDGMLGDLMAFGLVWGKPLASVLGMLSSALHDISGALVAESFSSTNGLIGQLTWLVQNQPIISMALAAAGLIAAALYSAKQDMEQLSDEILSEEGLDVINERIATTLEETDRIKREYNSTQENYEKEVNRIKTNAEEAAKLLDTILDTDQKLGNLKEGSKYYDELYAQQYANIEKLKTLVPEMASVLEQDSVGRLVNAEALREQGDAYLEYVEKMARAEATKQAYTDTYKEWIDASLNREEIISETNKQSEMLRRAMQEEEALAREQQSLMQGLYDDRLTPQEQQERLSEIGDELFRQQTIVENAQARLKELAEKYPEINDLFKTAAERLGYLQDEMFTEEVEGRDIAWSGLIDQILAILNGDTGDKLSSLAQKYLDLKEAAQDSLQTQIDLLKELNTESEQSLSQIEENIGKNAERIRQRNAALQTIQEVLYGSGTVGGALSEDSREAVAAFVNALIEGNEVGSVIELGAGITAEGIEGYQWIVEHLPEIREWYEITNSSEGAGALSAIQLLADGATVAEASAAVAEAEANLGKSTIETKEGATQAGNAAEGAAVQLEQYAEANDEVTDASQQTSSSVKIVESAIEKAGDTASAKSGDIQSIVGPLHNIRSAALTAAVSVAALAAAINSLHSKEVNIVVNMSSGGQIKAISNAWSGFKSSLGFGASGHSGTGGHWSSGHSGTGGVWPAWGGLIGYLADGGFPGIGRGTDTVPAWLTPGEFVMRRGAVGLFGSNFMKRVNSMDIGGAFDALMMRISNPMNRGNTYNRDNHATVNQYFYGNTGQGYSQKRAYRFAGSL